MSGGITLRPHQERSVEGVWAAYKRRVKRVLLVAPTGFGKTATAAVLIARAVAKGRRVLFLVHRREIVLATYARLVAAGVACGVLMAGRPRTDAPVQVASVQTIAAREEHPPADFLVWDECHHCAADTYRAIHAQYPEAWHLGLTATPVRADRQGLRDAFDELVVGSTVRELQTTVDPATGHPYLAGCDVIAPPERQDGLAEEPVEAWLRLAGGRPTVAFFRSVRASAEFAVELQNRGIAARHVDGSTPLAERADTLGQFAAGHMQVVSNVAVLTEGWDAPRAKVCLLARGCGSTATYLQMVGRVLRAHDGERALVIDLAGVVHEHGMPDEDREFTLDGIAQKPTSKREWLRQCLVCGYVVKGVQSGRACDRCTTPWPVTAPTVLTPAPVSLVSGAAVLPRAELRRIYRELVEEAESKGYKPGWAGCRFKARFGYWPRGLTA